MAVRVAFQSKDPAEAISLPFDFTADLGTETIASVAPTSVTVDVGTDAAVASVPNGTPVVVGGLVYVPVKAGVHLVDYVVRCAATTNTGRVLVMAGLLPVRTA
jgi:hypothetical protein